MRVILAGLLFVSGVALNTAFAVVLAEAVGAIWLAPLFVVAPSVLLGIAIGIILRDDR